MHTYTSNWSDLGRCAGLAFNNPKLYDRIFFPEKGRPSNNPEFKKFCGSCPMQMICLKYAVVNQLEGVWGGTTQSQRDSLPPKLVEEWRAEAQELGYLEHYSQPKVEVVQDTAQAHQDFLDEILGREDFLFDFEYEEYLQKIQQTFAVFEEQQAV